MMKFNVWERVDCERLYIVEAETAEEAKRLVEEGEVDWHKADYHEFEVVDVKERNDD
jgi:hypothetical protein